MKKLINWRQKIIKYFTKMGMPEKLTPREQVVFEHIMEGMLYTEIADTLFISPKTVSTHASNIFSKCQCNSREQLENKYKKKFLKIKKKKWFKIH